jgi:hypothetical protein
VTASLGCRSPRPATIPPRHCHGARKRGPGVYLIGFHLSPSDVGADGEKAATFLACDELRWCGDRSRSAWQAHALANELHPQEPARLSGVNQRPRSSVPHRSRTRASQRHALYVGFTSP